jgi:hypothetical protein
MKSLQIISLRNGPLKRRPYRTASGKVTLLSGPFPGPALLRPGNYYRILFRFRRILSLDPVVPAALRRSTALEVINFLPACLQIVWRQTDARIIVHSGTIKDDGLVFGVLILPGIEFHGLFSQGPWNLFFPAIPAFIGTHVDDNDIGLPQQWKELFLCHRVRVIGSRHTIRKDNECQ